MKKMWKRFVSLLLACTLLAGMLPLSASAAVSAPGKDSEQYQYAQGILNQLNNELGDGDSKFQLSSAASLGGDSDLFTYVISRFYIDPETNKGTTDMRYVIVPGVGASDTTMPNYSSAKDGQPWAEAAVSTFYIAKGVTGIGSYAFASQPSLNNVVFQDASDLTYIGQRAFYDDDNAVFTDEGNGDGTTLNLSGVTTMGEYAFYNCDKLTGVELGNMTAIEGNGNTSNKIPNHAFTSTGVQSITVPSGIEEVGEYAFYDCPLNKDPYISLQEGLATIGNYAFGKNDAAPNTTMIGLTIPSSVESIGDHAFYNYKGLQTVTVLGKDNGGAKESALKHVGDAAFGDADHNAYSTTTTIQDAVNPEIEYTGLVGTQFYLPKELKEKDHLFVNGETCYTGDISPLTFDLTVPATCTTDGYNQYYQTVQDTTVSGEPLKLHVQVKIPALGHDWDKENPVTVDATCTNNAYTYEVCKNDKTHHRTTEVVKNSALGHNYEVTDVDQPAINADNKTATIVTYTCKNYSVVPEKNKHDGQEPAQYQWTIPATTLEATTTDSLADIASQLPKPQGSHAASLEWAEEDTFADLQEGEKSYHVRLKVNHATFADYSDNNFTIQVKVSKAKLDFSDVRFVNADRWIGVANEEFAVEGLPEGVNQETLIIEYKLKSASDEAWSETKPSDDQEAKYEVRVTFTYDNTKYQLVTDEKELLPPSEYKLGKGTEENTGTIIGDYTIAQLNMDNIVVETPSLTFNGTFQNPKGTPQNTIRLNGVPEQSKVTFSWGDSGEQVIDDTGTNPLVSGAAITDAGTYTIRVKVEKDKYQDFERDVEVTIAPQTLTTPTATTSPTYDPGKIQTGVPYDNDGRYTMEDNTGTDAGDYAAKATVYNKNNYVWSAGDTDKDGTVEIPWRILYKLLPKPTIQTGLETATYDGTAQTPVSVTSSDLVVSYAGDVLQAKYKDELAYTATNARETDANDYTVTVQLKNKNYKWSDQTDGNITLSWKIEPKQIKAPTVTVANKVYDGKPYNTDGAEITNLVHSDDSEGILELGADHTYYEGHAKLESAPTNAGNYAVEVDFDFVEGQKATNYQIVQNARQPFTINKAPATMEFGQKEVTKTYTAEGTDLQQVKVTNLVTVDESKPASDVYTVTYTYKYRADDESEWENEEHKIINPDAFVFTDVGQYQITAKWGAGTVSNNYTAADATYTLTITQAETQDITLTPDKLERWTAAEGQTPAKYTITYGAAATFAVTGKAALDNASISYAVKDGSEQGHDGEPADVLTVGSDGKVTIHQAGTATITVTAAETANVGAASVEYTVTVKKAKPTVSLTDNKLEVSYTGQPITGYDIAEPTANVVEGADQPTGDITYTFYTDSGCQDKVTTGGGTDKNVPIAVGTYYMKASYPGDTNYEPAESEPVTVTVTKAQLTVDAEGHTGTYDGDEHDPASITVTGVGGVISSGYTISYAKKTDGQTDAPDADSNEWKPDTQVKDVADSGDYWFKVVINEGDSYAPYIGSVTVDIDPKPLTVTKTVIPTKVYDGTVDATKNVTFQSINTGIVGETVEADRVSAVYDSPNANVDNFITITYQLTAGDNTTLANYSLDGEAVTGAEMSEKVTEVNDTPVGITPASITVAINDQEKVYDGSVATPSQSEWSVDEGKLYDVDDDGTKDDLGIALSIASGSKDAGTYAITGDWTNKNYDVTFTGNWTGEEHKGEAGTYTITPRPISVQIGNAEGFYGDAPVLTGVTLTYEQTGDNCGLASGETSVPGIELGTGANKESPVAEYTIYAVDGDNRVELINPVVIGNYNVTFTQNGTYTVKPRPITITIEDKESAYGCEIAKLAYSETLSEAYTGTNENVVFVGDDETDLKIALSTTAKKGSDAGTYPISGKVTNTDLAKNYAITWKGENPYQENAQQATYTVGKADLAVEFTNEEVTVSMGGTVNNPLKFINQSNSDEELGGQPQDVTVKYSSNDQGVATVNETTGEITLVGTGNATITAEVTSGGKNFNSGASDTYVIHVAQDGGLRTTVTPVAGLTYTGKMQNLVTYTTSPEGATVTFTVTAQESGDQCQIDLSTGIPQALDAGTYTVSWRTTLEGYREETGSITVTVAKADPSEGFTPDFVRVAYEENKIYDSTEDTILQVEVGYASEAGNSITYLSDDTQVARVENNNLETIRLNSVGTAHISAHFAETENFQEQTASFTLNVSQASTMIQYTVEDYKVTYDGQEHGSQITVTSPSEYTIKYSDDRGTSYTLNESPAITDAGKLTIYFQIQADGYKSASGTQTVTVEPKPIKENMIAGIAESYTYTGKEITFDDAISVHDEGVLLKQNTDYTVSYDQNTAVGTNTGSVTITGMGNYKESVTKNFTISPVDASDLTASLNRTFGYYRNSENNNATVTVTHGGHTVDSREIALTVTRQDSTIESGDVVKEGLKLTFNKAGIYTIHVVVAGTHTGAFDLTYTLLPQDVASDDFQVATDPVDRVWTYDGGNHAFGVTVTSGGTPLQKDVDFTLRYTYLPYVGSQEESKYDPESTEFTEAGIYTVIVEGTGNYTGHAELVALIQPRDLSDAGITAAFAQTELVYNGEAQEPGVTLTYNGTAITQLKDTEYYGNTNAGEAQALSAASAGCNNFTGARVDAFTIEKKSLNDSTITAKADPEEYYYTGHPVTPAVTVTDSGRNVDLSIGADYTVTSDAVGPGKVNATVTGTGNYTDMVTVEFTILPTGAEPVETLDLTVTPSEWTWDNGKTKAAISVTFNGKELNDTDYQLTVSKDGETPRTVTKEQVVELLSAPDEYTITATGVGAYNGSTDTETVTIQKIQPEVTVTATPNSLSGGGKVILTLQGEKLPNGTDLKTLLSVTAKNDNDVTLEDLHIQWPEDGSLTAELTLPNTSETYTFTLTFTGNEYYEAATASEQVVVAQQIISGGGGGPVEDQPANPDDTGVSDWLNTKDHLAYLAGYPGGTFGPDQNMTRAEAAQMFYNLLLEKDVEITVEFEDVPADAWYAKPVNTLASLGILSGVGNGRFDPERSITRAEFTVIAMKFANTSGGGVNIFSDVNEDDWFYSAVVDSTQYGWINGYPDGTFRPEATISRAEVTVIVNHMLGRAADRPYVIAHEEELNTFGDVNRGHWGYFHIAEATNAHEYHTEDGTESWTGLS